MDPRLADNLARRIAREIGLRRPAGGMLEDAHDVIAPERNPRDGPEPGGLGARLGRGQLRIALGVLGVAVMGEMEEAEVIRRQDDEEAQNGRHPIIEPPVLEGRAMDRFMQGGEEEDEDRPLQRLGRQPQERPRRYGDQEPGGEEGRQMPAQMDEPARIRQPAQMTDPVTGNRGVRIVDVVHVQSITIGESGSMTIEGTRRADHNRTARGLQKQPWRAFLEQI